MKVIKILILGGHGYIGSYLTSFLRQKYEVTSYGSRSQDYNKLTQEYLTEFEYIILLAGHSSVRMCLGPLESPWLNNVVNFKNLLSKTRFDQKIIYASSSSVYGDKNLNISTERDISLDYINNYDLTKTTLDLYALREINLGRNLMGLRFGTVNGSSPLTRVDLMINSMVFTALFNKEITVTNKHVRRPILYINDLARAIDLVLSGKFYPGVYNLASFNSTVNEISREVSRQTGVKINDLGDKLGVYNFEISSAKFIDTHGFKFEGTPEMVVRDVVRGFVESQPIMVRRNEYLTYTH